MEFGEGVLIKARGPFHTRVMGRRFVMIRLLAAIIHQSHALYHSHIKLKALHIVSLLIYRKNCCYFYVADEKPDPRNQSERGVGEV